jgi:hypothetical protein
VSKRLACRWLVGKADPDGRESDRMTHSPLAAGHIKCEGRWNAFDGAAPTHKAGHRHCRICERRGGGCIIVEVEIILTRFPELTSTG